MERVAKDRKGAPICGGMLVTMLVRSYGFFERGVENFLTLMPTRHFNILLYKWVRIVQDNGRNNYSIPRDDVVEQSGLGRRVRSRPNDVQEEPLVIPMEDEMRMDLYNRAMHRYQDNIGRGLNYQNLHTNILFQHL